MKPRRKWIRMLLLLSVGIGMVVMATILYRHPVLDLRRLSTPVVNKPAGYFYHYKWLSGHELLLMRDPLPQDPDPKGTWTVFRFDLNTGRETVLESLTKHYNKTMGHTLWIEGQPAPLLSPDRKRLLWWGRDDRMHAANLDGTAPRTWTLKGVPDYPTVLWLGDSRHWCAVWGHQHRIGARVFDFDHTDRAETFTTRIDSLDAGELEYRTCNVGSLHFMADTQNSAESKTHQFLDIDFTNKANPVKQFTVPRPASSFEERRRVSPDGTRIAWTFYGEQEDPLLSMLHKVDPSVKLQSHLYTSLWVSCLDGKEMHEIGRIQDDIGPDGKQIAGLEPYEFYSGDPYPINDKLIELNWTPDGKQLSFVCDGIFYTVPAE